jgi:hypothetical protein
LSHAQQPRADSVGIDTTDVTRQLEPLLDARGTTNQTSTQAAEQLADLRAHPLNLNQASAADLSALPGLSLGDAHRIVGRREAEGPYQSVQSLRTVEGMDAGTVRTVAPFLDVDPDASSEGFPSVETILSTLTFRLTQRVGRQLDLGRGYRKDRFLGPPGRLTTRLRLDHERRLQLALTLDKDPGEPVRWSPRTDTYGFDHVVGSLALRDLGPIETLVVGDFSAQYGQGVALWQGLRLGKGRDPVAPVQKTGRGIDPYRSASEANFFRGVAATVGLPGELSLTAFVSRRHRDASIDSSVAPTDAPFPVRTISTGGRHRTRSELARKGTFEETTLGGALEYRSGPLHLGTTGYHARFDRALRPGDQPYRQFRVAGRRTSMMSMYASAYLQDYTLFGEVGRTPDGVYGGLVGAAFEGRYAEAVVVGRHYPARFAPFHGNAFGEGGRTQNETGIYTGLDLQVAPKWTVGAYFDQFRSPWLRFSVPRPSTGWESRLVLEYEPRPWLTTYLQGRAQQEEIGTEYQDGVRELEGLLEERRYSARWHTEYTFSDALTLRTRLELSRRSVPHSTATGFFLAQGVRWRPHPSLTVDTRIAFFRTDGFAARIYAYEHDLRYSFSAPVFFDEGRRTYLLMQYEPVSALTIEAKYGVTRYINRSSIGSGLNQIDGARRREVRVQIQWTL